MLTAAAFILALALLIAIHEYGHYRVALACGVKVLRFSIGFGKPLYKRVSPATGIEYVIGSIPLGGYVRMLDERNEAVSAEQQHQAFNRQVLWKRVVIVAAGPVANLLLAVLLYSVVGWLGKLEPQAILSAPLTGSVAELSGLRSGDRVESVIDAANEGYIQSFEQLRWYVVKHAIAQKDLSLNVVRQDGTRNHATLPLASFDVRKHQDPFTALGFAAPYSPAVVSKVIAGGAADQAGLKAGDLIQRAFDVAVADAAQLRVLIRSKPSITSEWVIERENQIVSTSLTSVAIVDGESEVGRVDAYIGMAPQSAFIRLRGWDAVTQAIQKTWEMSLLSLQMVFKMITGQASLENLSGPLSIADYAGQSAKTGLTQYIAFLAVLSVSIGVLNLLPLPVLDGGHLMYYLWEGATGKPVSEQWAAVLQRVGVCILLAMMCIALINDIGRLWG